VYCGDVEEISQPLLPMGMKTPISILSPRVVSFVLHCSNSHATCSKCIGIHRFGKVSGGFRQFPPVSAPPAPVALAQKSATSGA
jgi:hypothetical protein